MENNIIYKNVDLNNFTSNKTGGIAKFFIKIDNVDDLINTLNNAKKESIPIFVLGGGSNVLINDKGFDGLVVRVLNEKLQINPIDDQTFNIVVGAG
ncbi:MAG: FAD-binding protein [Candidatus Shapirobacteria bacterium]